MECVWGAVLSPDARRVLCWNFDGVVCVLDARDGDPIGEFLHASPAWGAVFDRSGDRILTWDRDGNLVMLQMPQNN